MILLCCYLLLIFYELYIITCLLIGKYEFYRFIDHDWEMILELIEGEIQYIGNYDQETGEIEFYKAH